MPRPNHLTNFFELPEIVSGYPLPPYFGLVIPINEERTNLINNPSFETDDNNWSGSAISVQRSVDSQWSGTFSYGVSPSLLTSTVFYGVTTPLSLTAGSVYAVSMRFLNLIGGISYNFYIATTGGVKLVGTTFKSTGFWQWIWFLYTETSTTTRRLYITPNSASAIDREFLIDAVQVELTSAGKRYPTTYIDGDQVGLTPGEFPLPYYWTGTPHASTSTRSQFTRSGGRVVNLQDLGLIITTVSGLALPVPQVVSLPFGQLDGEQYQRTRKESREFTIAGRVTGRSTVQLDQLFGSLSREFDRDSFSRDEPLILKYQPLDEQEQIIGPELDIISVYQGGIEGQRNNLNSEIFTATFKKYLPALKGHSDGSAITANTVLTNANASVRQTNDNVWRAISTGFTGGTNLIQRIAIHPNGTVYFGGNFTDAGGSGADHAAKYNPITNVLSVVKAATTFNAQVLAVAVGPNGNVFFGGAFTNADGIANADGIVEYNPTTDTFTALGTGVSAGASVNVISFDKDGILYAGGNFASMGGVANTAGIAKWNGSAWSALGTGISGGIAYAITAQGSNVYVGGSFTGAGGVANTGRIARWNGTTWNAMSTGVNTGVAVYALAISTADGYLYVGGDYSQIGGVSISNISKWNGVTFIAVGSTLNGQVDDIDFDPSGTGYIGGLFTTAGGIVLPDRIVRYDGGAFVPISIDLPGTPEVIDVTIDKRSGTLYLGYNTTGSATVSVNTTITNSGTGQTYPTIVLKGPSSGSSRFYSIVNNSTGHGVYLNYTILAGETAILVFDPDRPSFTSDFQGDISDLIMPGSEEANFYLAKGINIMSVLAIGSPTISIYWSQGFLSTSDAVGVI